jgi:hypothetical protein
MDWVSGGVTESHSLFFIGVALLAAGLALGASPRFLTWGHTLRDFFMGGLVNAAGTPARLKRCESTGE